MGGLPTESHLSCLCVSAQKDAASTVNVHVGGPWRVHCRTQLGGRTSHHRVLRPSYMGKEREGLMRDTVRFFVQHLVRRGWERSNVETRDPVP